MDIDKARKLRDDYLAHVDGQIEKARTEIVGPVKERLERARQYPNAPDLHALLHAEQEAEARFEQATRLIRDNRRRVAEAFRHLEGLAASGRPLPAPITFERFDKGAIDPVEYTAMCRVCNLAIKLTTGPDCVRRSGRAEVPSDEAFRAFAQLAGAELAIYTRDVEREKAERNRKADDQEREVLFRARRAIQGKGCPHAFDDGQDFDLLIPARDMMGNLPWDLR